MIPAGISWVSLFPTSTSIVDLASPFRENCEAFIQALKTAGASVTISATYRPPERAFLMHWCSMIGGQAKADPASVPVMAGVDIQWVLETPSASILAARKMMEAYGIVYPAALVSRHTQRLAIDMTIKDAPVEGDDLYAMGKSFGVIKLPLSVLNDPPHWSSDGH